MSSLWEQRAARNEALFREVNENIARLEKRHGTTSETQPVYLCECANADCTDQLAVELDAYQQTRQNPRRFLLRPGHEDPRVERVIERHAGYLVVEKTGAAGDAAARLRN